MKVLAPGTLAFLPTGQGVVTGWTFQLLDGETYDLNSKVFARAQLAAVLGYIATCNGIDLEPESVTPAPAQILREWHAQDIAASRAASNTIAKARGR